VNDWDEDPILNLIFDDSIDYGVWDGDQLWDLQIDITKNGGCWH